ncbi:MAG: energy transducer TonB [Bacteroidota bacterium]
MRPFILIAMLFLAHVASAQATDAPPEDGQMWFWLADTDTAGQSINDMEQEPKLRRSMNEYLFLKLKTPLQPIRDEIEGPIIVEFLVASTGYIHRVRIVQGLSPEVDKEVLSAISAMPRWKPGRINGKKVNVWCALALHFPWRYTYENPNLPGYINLKRYTW